MKLDWKIIVGLLHKTTRKIEMNISFDDIESKVRPLVKAINIHYQTRMSCEGHIDHGCSYPWVDLVNFQEVRYFEESLKKYNLKNKPTWVLHESHFDPDENATVLRLMPECKVYSELSEYRKMTMCPKKLKELEAMSHEDVSLETFQCSAKSLAQFLDESWK